MITLDQYYMGRDRAYANELTAAKRENAAQTVAAVNLLIAAFEAAGLTQHISPLTKTALTSGWRPLRVNANTPGAAPNSKHTTCQAVDLYDPDGELDEWALAHPEVLAKIGLWQEHPASTKGWIHVQIVPPKSGNRVFYP